MSLKVGHPGIRRRRLLLIPLLAGVLLTATAACGGGNAADEDDHASHPDVVGRPSFVLQDTEGQRFDFLRETRGSATLLYFGYRSCPDLCPTELATIAAALRGLPPAVSREVKVVFVTVDPARDGVEEMREWLDIFDESFIGLTGSMEEIENAGRAAFGSIWQSPQKFEYGDGRYAVSHPSIVLGYSSAEEGPIVYSHDLEVGDLRKSIRRMVEEG